MTNAITTQENNGAIQQSNGNVLQYTPMEVLEQVKSVQSLMQAAMKDGEHYGTIPGCGDKPTLKKPGSEKLCFMFRLRPEYHVQRTDMQNGHREYEVTCTLYSIATGQIMGQGVGSCNTMESKYRYRTGPKESTGQQVPRAYWDNRKTNPQRAQEIIGGKGFSVGKENGVWMIMTQGEKVEHDNPADYYNTVLKMAKKRASVDATITATAASDIFTQDIEDIKENERAVSDADYQDVSDTQQTPPPPSQQNGNVRRQSRPQQQAQQGNSSPRRQTSNGTHKEYRINGQAMSFIRGTCTACDKQNVWVSEENGCCYNCNKQGKVQSSEPPRDDGFNEVDPPQSSFFDEPPIEAYG